VLIKSRHKGGGEAGGEYLQLVKEYHIENLSNGIIAIESDGRQQHGERRGGKEWGGKYRGKKKINIKRKRTMIGGNYRAKGWVVDLQTKQATKGLTQGGTSPRDRGGGRA